MRAILNLLMLIAICLLSAGEAVYVPAFAAEFEYSYENHDHIVTGDTQSWMLERSDSFMGDRRKGFEKITRKLPFVIWVPAGEVDSPRRVLMEHAKNPAVYQRVVFDHNIADEGVGMMLFKPTATRADWEWEKTIAPTWVVDPPDGADFKRQRNYNKVANSGFNGWKSVRMTFSKEEKPFPIGGTVEIEHEDNRIAQMKDPDWFGAKFNAAAYVTVEKIAGQGVFRWESTKNSVQFTWPSRGCEVKCSGWPGVMNEVTALTLSKHPSDLPANYKHFSVKTALVHEIERQIPLLTEAINEPPRELCDRYKPWAWVVGLGHLSVDGCPTMTEKDGKDWQNFIIPTAKEYEKVQVDLWEQFVWGPKPAEPLIDLDGYTKAVLAWRKNVLDVRLPKILKRLKAGDVKYDSKLRYWRFND